MPSVLTRLLFFPVWAKVLFTSSVEDNATAHRDSLLAIEALEQQLPGIESWLELNKPGAISALRTLFATQRATSSILKDLAHTLRAVEFMVFVSDDEGYAKAISAHVVVILAAYDEKVNSTYFGHSLQEAISTLDTSFDATGTAMKHLKGAIRSYNRLVEPHRSDLGDIRNTIGAHRNISTVEVQKATERLTPDFMKKLVVAVYQLDTAFRKLCLELSVAFGRWAKAKSREIEENPRESREKVDEGD